MFPLLLASLLGVADAAPIDRLEPPERAHFDALRVWMDKRQEKDFLKLKSREARDQWLKDNKLWDRFYQYAADVRAEIVAGNVAVGWMADQVYMAWGPPFQKVRTADPGVQRSEKLVYLLEVTPEGKVLVWEPGSKETHNAIDRYRYELVVHNGMVVEKLKKPGWE